LDKQPDFPINLSEADHDLVLHAPIPGTEPENIVVRIADSSITIKSTARGSRQEPAKWYMHEWHIGNFDRTILLPYTIDSDRVNVTYNNGVLTVSMTRGSKTKKREIRLTTVSSGYGGEVGHRGNATRRIRTKIE
jgi:HSP20 family protein